MIEKWKYMIASVQGTSHIQNNSPCQDSSLCQIIPSNKNEEILISIVSDGAGSSKYSDIGSNLACSIFFENIKKYLSQHDLDSLTKDDVESWIDLFQQEIQTVANNSGVYTREYACTILTAIIGLNQAVFFQLGDGAIVIFDNEVEEYAWQFWPQKGEYENTTFFITGENAKNVFVFDKTDKKIDEVCLFTDGVQHLALHYQSQMAYSAFFKPFFRYLRMSKGINFDERNKFLVGFLNSEKINNRTDDDKTLIFATRRGVSNNVKECN